MSAVESLRAGDTEAALRLLQEQVRSSPADPKLRVFLFQLLAVRGDWNRALKQLSVVGEMDASALPMVQTYREALRCEALRAQVFAGERSPLVFGDPSRWIALLVEALGPTAAGQAERARQLRDEAFELAPAVPGSVDGEPFQWLADADPRLGPVLEVVLAGRYYWVPFDRLAMVEVEEPADLRDVVWMPAHLRFSNGGESVALIPARYPGSESADDGQLQLGRRTEWVERGPGLFVGLGQRVLATDAGEHSLMDVRRITLDSPAEAPPPGGGDA